MTLPVLGREGVFGFLFPFDWILYSYNNPFFVVSSIPSSHKPEGNERPQFRHVTYPTEQLPVPPRARLLECNVLLCPFPS